jgi:hypothetical protein
VRHVDHRRVDLLDADRGRLERADPVIGERDVGIERRRGRQRRREDRPEAVDRVEREQDRDVQPRVLDGVVLVLVDQRRIGLTEHAADRLARLLRVLLHLPVGEQRQLLQLLVERHPPQQRLDPALDAAIASRALHS